MRLGLNTAFALIASCAACGSPERRPAVFDSCKPVDEIANDGIDQDCSGGDLIDADADGWPATDDCDDGDARVHPGAPETCDGMDQDCDGEVDEEAIDAHTGYLDRDGDGYGDESRPWTSCEALGPTEAGDCDDSDADIFPGAVEVCDGVDQDCDGQVDEDAIDMLSGFEDADGDGYGDSSRPWDGCARLGPTAGGDCNDGDPAVNPDATEACGNAVDDNCDGYRDQMVAGITHATISDALEAACEDGDTVWVSTGTYVENVVIDRSIVLQAIDGPDSTRIEAAVRSGENPVVRVTSDGVEIRGLELRYGHGDLFGGGLSARYVEDLTVDSCRFVNNSSAGDGGGLYCACSGRIEANEFHSNTASYGGGVFVFGGSDREVILAGNTFDNNAAEFGGGAYQAFGGPILWFNNRLAGNTATRFGGGIGAIHGLQTDGNTITGNQAGEGCGGVWADRHWDGSNDSVRSNSPDDWSCIW